MKELIDKIHHEIDELIISTKEDLEDFRLRYLSKKGAIASLFGEFRKVPNEEKKELGAAIDRKSVV